MHQLLEGVPSSRGERLNVSDNGQIPDSYLDSKQSQQSKDGGQGFSQISRGLYSAASLELNAEGAAAELQWKLIINFSF